MRRTILYSALLLAARALAQDAAPLNTLQYEAQHEFDCNGPLDTLASPDVREYGGYKYTYNGGTVAAERKDKPKKRDEIRIGVLAGIKDLEKETQADLDDDLAQ